MNWKAQRPMDEDIEEHREMYRAFSGEEIYEIARMTSETRFEVREFWLQDSFRVAIFDSRTRAIKWGRMVYGDNFHTCVEKVTGREKGAFLNCIFDYRND